MLAATLAGEAALPLGKLGRGPKASATTARRPVAAVEEEGGSALAPPDVELSCDAGAAAPPPRGVKVHAFLDALRSEKGDG